MGGVYEYQSCFGTSGYATRRFTPFTSEPTQFSDTITITLSKPRTVESFRFQTKPLTSYQITLNDSVSRIYEVGIRHPWEPENLYKNLFFVAGLGFTPQRVRNVTKISIKALDSDDWNFGIDNVRFGDPPMVATRRQYRLPTAIPSFSFRALPPAN